MSYTEEFQTVDLLLGSRYETRGVDAFALTLIKAERQMRRLVTYLVFQFPCFSKGDGEQLRDSLAKKKVYFDGLERGFDALYRHSIRDLIGSDYDKLRRRLREAGCHRNKIFHGQITLEYLSRQELLGYVCDIRSWCKAIASAALSEFRYDGFGRNSFRKSEINDLSISFKLQFSSVRDYENFICIHMVSKQCARKSTRPTRRD
jgi:hypothetical protein